MQKQTGDEVDGRQRLLSHISRLLSEDEAQGFIANLRLVIDVPVDLETRAIRAFRVVRDAVETNETRRAEAAAADCREPMYRRAYQIRMRRSPSRPSRPRPLLMKSFWARPPNPMRPFQLSPPELGA